MKKRVNLMIEDYDDEYLESTAKAYHMSKSDLVKVAINLLTSTNAEGDFVLEQLAKKFDAERPMHSHIPLNEKVISASRYANVEIASAS